MTTGFRMAVAVMIGFAYCFVRSLIRLRTLRIFGRGHVMLPRPLPTLPGGETATMLPTFCRVLATAGVILAGEGGAAILALGTWQRTAQGCQAIRKEQDDRAGAANEQTSNWQVCSHGSVSVQPAQENHFQTTYSSYPNTSSVFWGYALRLSGCRCL